MSVNAQTPAFSSLVSGLHSVASLVEEVVSAASRWNRARVVSDDLHGLTFSQRRDLGLDGVDLDDMARLLAR